MYNTKREGCQCKYQQKFKQIVSPFREQFPLPNCGTFGRRTTQHLLRYMTLWQADNYTSTQTTLIMVLPFASPKHIYEISTKVTKKFMHFLSCSIFIQYKSTFIYFNYETLFFKFHTQIFHADCIAISDSGLGSEISSNTTKVACVDVHLPTLIPTNHEAKKTRPKSIAVKNRLICVLFYFVDLLIFL